MPPPAWAKLVVHDLLKNKPPPLTWRGHSAITAWLASILPYGLLDGAVKKATKYNQIEEILKHARE